MRAPYVSWASAGSVTLPSDDTWRSGCAPRKPGLAAGAASARPARAWSRWAGPDLGMLHEHVLARDAHVGELDEAVVNAMTALQDRFRKGGNAGVSGGATEVVRSQACTRTILAPQSPMLTPGLRSKVVGSRSWTRNDLTP